MDTGFLLRFPFILLVTLMAKSVLGQDFEISETVELPLSHSLGWVRRNIQPSDQPVWDGVLDEAKWGSPSKKQAVARNWEIPLSDEEWEALVAENEPTELEEVTYDLWIPEGKDLIRGVVAMSAHGTGQQMFEDPNLREIARDRDLALFRFVGNPVQRGFWPRSLLFEQLRSMGEAVGYPEIGDAPLFLYGHSNGTGFSAFFPAAESDRVWGWVSMRPGTTFQVYQPGAANVPGLVIFGEEDSFLTRPSVEENLAVVPAVRKNHDAVWNYVVEAGTGHGPTAQTWPLVYAFLVKTFEARVPEGADPREGPVELIELSPDSGWRGAHWDPVAGGHQELEIAPVDKFTGDVETASWLLDEEYAEDWQAFQRDGLIE
ncbi:hypothetical protein [Puniceicoccus vermicola]|nr:hypothetical protein [Puniceicoccus vermicola]